MGIISQVLFNIKNMKKAKQLRAMGKDGLLKLDDDKFYEAMFCICDDAVFDINHPGLTKEQRSFFTASRFEAEVNNGGLCQYFVNSTHDDYAVYVSESLDEIGAAEIKELFDSFVSENGIDVRDLSSFKIKSADEFIEQTKRYDFDFFDDKFYENEDFHELLIKYARDNIEKLLST